MINGLRGRQSTFAILAALVALIALRAVMLLFKDAMMAADSLNQIITLLTGLFVGAVGINPYVNAKPPTLYDPNALSELKPGEHP